MDSVRSMDILPSSQFALILLPDGTLVNPAGRYRFQIRVQRNRPGLPSFAESHGWKPVDECEVGTLRSLGEGGYASEGSALRSVWRGATAVRPWGFTITTGLPWNQRGYFNDALVDFGRELKRRGNSLSKKPGRANLNEIAERENKGPPRSYSPIETLSKVQGSTPFTLI